MKKFLTGCINNFGNANVEKNFDVAFGITILAVVVIFIVWIMSYILGVWNFLMLIAILVGIVGTFVSVAYAIAVIITTLEEM